MRFFFYVKKHDGFIHRAHIVPIIFFLAENLQPLHKIVQGR